MITYIHTNNFVVSIYVNDKTGSTTETTLAKFDAEYKAVEAAERLNRVQKLRDEFPNGKGIKTVDEVIEDVHALPKVKPVYKKPEVVKQYECPHPRFIKYSKNYIDYEKVKNNKDPYDCQTDCPYAEDKEIDACNCMGDFVFNCFTEYDEKTKKVTCFVQKDFTRSKVTT